MKKKWCSMCQTCKSIDDFYIRRNRPNGRQAYCKKCSKKKTVAYHRTEKGKAYQKQYNQSDAGKAAQRRFDKSPKGKAKRERLKKTKKYKVAHRKVTAKYKLRHPEKIKAQDAIYYAVHSQKIPHPTALSCIRCNKQAIEYHHHKGYDKDNRLDVVPVCKCVMFGCILNDS